MASLCHNLYWHQWLYGTDFLHLTFFAQNTTKTSIFIVLNICETSIDEINEINRLTMFCKETKQ
jgi:hypothetical protein